MTVSDHFYEPCLPPGAHNWEIKYVVSCNNKRLTTKPRPDTSPPRNTNCFLYINKINLSQHSFKHCYFNEKDVTSIINTVMN